MTGHQGKLPALTIAAVAGLGAVDLGLSLFYAGLFVLVVVLSYLSLSRRNSRN